MMLVHLHTYLAPKEQDEQPSFVRTCGTRIRIYEDRKRNNRPRYKVLGRAVTKGSTKMLPEVVDFLNDLQNLVLPYISQADLPVLSEHKRDKILFRAHPNFMGRGPWKDWVLVDWGEEGVLPCHIQCFVDLTSLDSGSKTLQFGGIDLKPNAYAVVECGQFDEDEEEQAKSDIFKPITLEVKGIDEDDEDGRQFVTGRTFYLADVEAFQGVCAVIPNLGGPPNAYLHVKPEKEWSMMFEDWLRKPHTHDANPSKAQG